MKSTYSFGEESPLKFQISDKLAKHYNEAASEYFRAQRRFMQRYGRKWDPETDPIALRWTNKQKWAWNEFAKVFEQVRETQGPFHANDIMDDFLVKNAGSAAAVASRGFGRPILFAAGCGALYGYLRRR